MEMDSGPIFELIAGYDDTELLERLRAMEKQLRPVPLARLAAVPSYIGGLQTILDRAEEDGKRSEPVLDEIREMLQRFRSYVVVDLQQARGDFESLHQRLAEKGLTSEAAQAKAAVERIAEMQRTQRVAQEQLPELDDLYGTLLSPLAFDRSKNE